MTYEDYMYQEYLRYAEQEQEEAVELTQFIFLIKYFEEAVDVSHFKV